MLHWLKKHFIPHPLNEHRPHILRKKNITIIIVAVLLLECFVFLLPTFVRLNLKGGVAAVLPTILADFTNEERKDQNLQILSVSELLNKAALLKAQDMARNGYFAHVSPDGKTPWYWLSEVGYEYKYAGENLAVNFSDSKDVTDAWMASTSHRANIIKENYTEIGTGVAIGMYEGKETMFVAQVYANPLSNISRQEKPKSQLVVNKGKKVAKTNDSVLGATSDPLGLDSQIALALKTNEKALSAPKDIKVNLLKRILASPRDYTNKMLYFVFSIITLALLLKIIIKFEHRHHLDLITNGLVVLSLIGAIFVTNYHITHKDMVITQTFDYVNPS
ncbi:MAG: CAP domain-containing protein [Patescibacteria group bacterium]